MSNGVKESRIVFSIFVLITASQLPLARASSLQELQKSTQARIASDQKTVEVYRRGISQVLAYCATRTDLFPPAKRKEKRMLSREQREDVQETWRSFLDYLLALDGLRAHHKSFYLLEGDTRDQSFLTTYAAFLAQYRFALAFIERAENEVSLDKLLNEAVPEIGLPENSYYHLKLRFLSPAIATEFAAQEVLFKALKMKSRVPATLYSNIQEDAAYIWKTGRGKGEMLTARNAFDIVKKAGKNAWFPVQSNVSEWMGDMKVRRLDQSLISNEQIASMLPRLEPGDILLERREWYLSNIGLPGYWPHAALYIGTPPERKEYFVDEDVQQWLRGKGQRKADFDELLRSRYPKAYAWSLRKEAGHPPRIIEAISEGVSFTSLEHSADADSVAVLRPRLSKREKAIAIYRAFGYAGRPYDFDFDFVTDSSLVCTELIYKSYEPSDGYEGLRFPLVRILGRQATPANELVRQFDAHYGSAEQQSDFVLFFDGVEQLGKAVESGLEEFRESWKRPKWHIFLKQGQ